MSALPPVIAVDGPSGVGKGMVTRWLAQRLGGWHRLDSGALYRILGSAAYRQHMDLSDFAAVAALAPQLAIEFRGFEEADEHILVNGEDWTAQIRSEEAGGLASRIAAAPVVREALLQRQYDFRQWPGLIADGRDMGTVVFPDAQLKIFLDASPDERALRRLRQLSKAGQTANLDDLRTQVRLRDERDRTRAVAPLVAAEDAVIVDTSGLPVPAVLERIGALLAERGLV